VVSANGCVARSSRLRGRHRDVVGLIC
jgi:hypothetical protein